MKSEKNGDDAYDNPQGDMMLCVNIRSGFLSNYLISLHKTSQTERYAAYHELHRMKKFSREFSPRKQ